MTIESGLRSLALALVLVAGAEASAQEVPEGTPDAAFLQRSAAHSLLFELEYGRSLSSERLLEELRSAGAELVGGLYAALGRDEGAGVAAPGGRRIEAARRKVLLDALAGIPLLVESARIASTGESEESARDVEIALAVLAHTGDEKSLDLLMRLAGPRAAEARVPRSLARAFEDALAGMLQRRPALCERLGRDFRHIAPALRPSAARALGSVADHRTLELLGDLLGIHPTLDLSLLSQIGRVGVALGQPIAWKTRLRVRSYLGSPDPALRREAAVCAGKLEDVEAVPELITLLDDEHAGVQQNALWALRAQSGKNMGADARRWSDWHETEVRWWNGEAQSALAGLELADEVGRVRSLAELSSHRLFRHELAAELLWFLRRPEPQLVRAVCSTLGSLRSGVAVPGLIELLRHEDEAVRRQAHAALRSITGRELPMSHAAWAALLAP